MELGPSVTSYIVRGRQERGLHQWVVAVTYFVQEPERSIIVIDERMLATVGQVRCGHCSWIYSESARFAKCPFAPVTSPPDEPAPSA